MFNNNLLIEWNILIIFRVIITKIINMDNSINSSISNLWRDSKFLRIISHKIIAENKYHRRINNQDN